jgi:FkbM family methyltransferase
MRSTQELQSQTVSVVSLDRYVQERGLNGVDLVKIDTESTEPQVLRG